MTIIKRCLKTAANENHDLIIVGGGIYGCCLALESARRGLRCLLVEQADFGHATSWNSLRIIHGGLRYLQHADLRRFRRSVTEQSWWLENFPDLVAPLPCLMPLYNRGLRRTSTMRAALWANNQLAKPLRSEYVRKQLPTGGILDAKETVSRFPAVVQRGLAGGAVWHDARMLSPARLLIEVLRWAVAAGAQTLNYVRCDKVLFDSNRVRGVQATCQLSGEAVQLTGDHVVNCAGPDAERWADSNDAPVRHGTGLATALNLVIRRPSLSDHALALTPDRAGAPTYFWLPEDTRSLWGTIHLKYTQRGTIDNLVNAALRDLRAVSGLSVGADELEQVMIGHMPAGSKGSHAPGKSPRIVCHQRAGAPCGFTTVLGVKYTTARDVAERTLCQIFRQTGLRDSKQMPSYQACSNRPAAAERPDLTMGGDNLPQLARELRQWAEEESVQHIDDLLLRRFESRCLKDELPKLGLKVMQQLGWEQDRQQRELERLDTLGSC